MLHHVIVGEGKPLLFLHGSTLDHRHMMAALEPVFAQRGGWQRLYIDMPGHGKSPARDDIGSQDDLLAAVMDFARDRLGDRRFGIIGESRGSYIARVFVHHVPQAISGAALIVPGCSPTADPSRLPAHEVIEADPELGAGLTGAERHFFENLMVIQRPDILEKWRAFKGPAKALWDAEQEARVGARFDFSFEGKGARAVFSGPSVIIAGRQDRMSGFLDAIDLLPSFARATLAVLDGGGHGLAWERPALFNALMADWLDRLEPAF